MRVYPAPTLVTRGPPESPWQASDPGLDAQIILGESTGHPGHLLVTLLLL